MGTGSTAPAAKPSVPAANIGSGVLTPIPSPAPTDPSATLIGGGYVPVFGVGTVVGSRFVIEGLLGEGGMGRVYKAYDRELDRYVALKVLQPELARDPQIIQRFKHELLLASRISHKNILRIHDLNDASGLKFISMTYVEGEDLHHLLSKESPLPLNRSLKIARQLCEALAAAHAEGVVHRDFKPQNVLVGKEDQVYVSDFGLATSLETAKLGMTRTGAFVGTPRYMSPEQVEGGKVDHRSDLYSLGLVIYELVTGDLPFTGESTWQLMYQRVKEKPKDPKAVRPDLPDWVSRIVLHCLEREPQNRYQSATEILADIDANRSPTITHGTLLQRRPGLKWGIAGATGLAVIAGLLLAIPAARHLVIKGPSVSLVDNSGLPPLSKGKLVAVLPFRVLGNDSMNYVAEGLDEALSAKLFQLNSVRLASPSAAAKVNDQTTPLPQIAKNLGVNMIVHGLVQGSGQQLRIVVNLENMEDNRLQWSKEFSGVTGDLLTIEDQIYAQLVEALALKPTNAEQARASAHPTQNIEAYSLYLQGRNALRGQQDPKNVRSAIDFFNEAVAKDSGFALAYAGVADACLIMYRETKDSSWSAKALGAALQARALSEDQPEVHLALGSVYRATGKTTEALVELKRALELTPNSDEAYRRLASAYLANNQSAEAIQAYQRAVATNPYYWVNYNSIGNAYYQLGDYGKAAESYRRVIELDPTNPYAYNNLGAVLLQSGEFQAAVEPLEKALQFNSGGQAYSNLGAAYFYLKEYNKAITVYEKAVQLTPTSDMYVGNLAEAYELVGEKARGQATFEKAISLAYKDLQVNPRNAVTKGRLALWYAKKGDVQQALKFIADARVIDPDNVDLIYYQAQILALANDNAKALEALRDAFKKGQPTAIAQAEPDLQNLQKDPGFQKLIKEFARAN